jgi:hypothetical protein
VKRERSGNIETSYSDTYEHHRRPLEMPPCQISSKRCSTSIAGGRKVA